MGEPLTRYFGIRHHGPGCARSLLQALDAWQPDCVLVEGPPEADELLHWVLDAAMVPPVALLSYCPDEPQLAVYHPFAEFSPEWQALQWAARAQVPLRFIDLPRSHDLALDRQAREAAEAARAADTTDTANTADKAHSTEPIDTAESTERAESAEDAASTDAAAPDVPDAPEAAVTTPPPQALPTAHPATLAVPPSRDGRYSDPLGWLAQAAGWSDGEAWWNQMVEERREAGELFDAITEAMTQVRQTLEAQQAPEADTPPDADAHDEARREALREAYMRQCVRAAQKEGHQRIAVVCGAWHLAGLKQTRTAKADSALLKGLPKVKVQSTWVPWTYRHLTRSSGYGAGIESPGWYEHLWLSSGGGPLSGASDQPRAAGWLARVARLMRARDLDCSSAHLIEATRLADTLAALRERPTPGLAELQDAARAVLTLGDDTVLNFIRDELIVGERLGQVPAGVPTVPLQRDLEQQQKTLRLKPEALHKNLDLDLRQPGDLARSRLLHRLQLLGVGWGELARTGRASRGSFHEVWALQWKPEFPLALIEASPWGHTVERAATARTLSRCAQAQSLSELAAVVDVTLLAELPEAVNAATLALQNRAALSADALQLLGALPPLANVFRYGNVRQTDASLVGQVLDGLIVRAAIALPLAAQALDEEAANTLREKLLAAHGAVQLRDGAEQSASWQRALDQLASHSGAHALLRGTALRLQLDAGACGAAEVAQQMSLQLSSGAEPAQAAAWLDGFLNRNATLLLHDSTLWSLLDAWLVGLSDEHFLRVLPLVRRSFSAFGPGERRDLAQRAAQGAPAASAAPAAEADWDEARAALPLPALRQWLGLVPGG